MGIDIETCPAWGAAVRIIAAGNDPEVVEMIPVHRYGIANAVG